MHNRHQQPKPRGRITAPRRHTANPSDSLTLDDIPNVLHAGTVQRTHTPAHPIAAPQSPPTPAATIAPAKPTASSRASLASQRTALGFDDIPVASPQEIKKARSRQEKNGRFSRLFRTKRLSGLKSDIQWALAADRDDNKKSVAKPTRRQQNQTHAKPTADSTKTIDITISFDSLPKIPPLSRLAAKLPRMPRLTWTRKKTKLLAAGAAAVGVLAVLYYLPITQQNLPQSKNEGPALAAAATPTYQTILPSGKSESAITWQRISPPDRDPVYAYSDTIDNVKISVSQQPLPSSFKKDSAGSIADLAKNYAATDKITAGDTQLYIGTSGQGPQSVIFTKNDLLILIKSSSKLSHAAWTNYVTTLQPGAQY